MDKMRAIQYFNTAVEAGSFAAAARKLDVSTPAVTQLIASLEQSLGCTLFHRSSRGIALTADGEQYHVVSSSVALKLLEVEQRLGPRGAKPRGTLCVGMRTGVGHSCVMPQIAKFLVAFPDVELIVRPMETLDDFDRLAVDLALVTGWPPERDFVVRTLAQTRNIVCASPAYWSRMGMPREPEDLHRHECLVFRSSGGAMLDRWTFERGGEQRIVDVRARLLSDGSAWIDEAACGGAGVIRKNDLSLARYLARGLLIPALTDWAGLDAPLHFVAFRRAQRQSKPVRAFIDFLVGAFAEVHESLPPTHGDPRLSMAIPSWYGRAHGRLSVFASKNR